MAVPFTTTSLKKYFRPAIMNLADKFQHPFLHKRLTVLSISLVNGRFKAMSIINDSIHQSWERPGVILKPEAFRQAIADAIHQTQFSGTHISLLVEDPRFITQTLQLPAMELTDLLLILQRKVQQEKTWDGPAAWRYRLGIQGRGKQNIYLEIWPQSFLDEIIRMCEELGLQLRQLAPLSALSESQLKSLPVEPGDATILISMLEGKIMFVAGGDDGTPMMTRHLAPAHDWVPLGERVGTEVNRTIMYLIQQTNLTVPQIWFLGEEELLTPAEVQPHVSTPILPFPVHPDWKFWLWVAATLPINHDTNFTPSHVLRAPLQNLLTKSVAAAVGGLILLGVGTTGILEGYFAKNKDGVQAIAQQVHSLQQDQQQWQGQLVALQTKRQWIQTVTGSHSPSIEGPFLGYLGTILPQQTILHKASIIRRNTTWDVELTGSIITNLSESLSLLENLTRELKNGPYHLTIQPNWRDQLLTQTTTSSPQHTAESRYRFTLKGHMT